MPRIDLNQLDDDARIWIFGISPPLDAARSARMLAQVDAFLDGWTAHEVPVRAARELRDGAFLIVAVDKDTEQSGCSIDRMFGLLRQFERDFGVAILDPNRVFVRGGDGGVHSVTRAEFRESGDPHTLVFDTLAERLGEVRRGRWERRAEESWHRNLLRRTA
ncbi:MAG TPA: hypothetical protein VG323_11115 [Thermoanaerobaculia bacterium]|nr:hypothetical protein [Thermoanaerobaculia bacterium]